MSANGNGGDPEPFHKPFESLTELDVSHNSIRQISEKIMDLKSLEILNLEHNSLFSLPRSLASLSRLQSLKIHSSKVAVLPQKLPPCLVRLTVCQMRIDVESEVCFFQFFQF